MRKNHPHRKVIRKENAEARQAKYAVLTVAQRLANPHLGAKERRKLEAR